MGEMTQAEMRQAEATYPPDKLDKSGAHDQLAHELERLSDQLDRLDNVLTPVLNPPSPNAVPGSEPVIRSPLRGHAELLGSLNVRLSELLGRVDL